MPDNSVYNLLSTREGRQKVIDALIAAAGEHPEDETLPYLSQALSEDHYIFPLSPEQVELIERTAPSLAAQPAARFSEPDLEVGFVPIGIQEGLGNFLEIFRSRIAARDPAGMFGSETAFRRSFEDEIHVSLRIAARWGTQREAENGERPEDNFVEPSKKNLDSILKIYNWANRVASQYGMRVDIWELLAAIYPPVREMLQSAESTDSIVNVRAPGFMSGIGYENFDLRTYSRMVRDLGLAEEMSPSTVRNHGDPDRTVRPRIFTSHSYARSTAARAGGGETREQQMFRFVFLLRLLQIDKDIVSVQDDAGRFIRRSPYPSNYNVVVLPEDSDVEYVSGGAAQLSIRRWPAIDIASGRFDDMLYDLDRRLTLLEALSGFIDMAPEKISGLREKLSRLETGHEVHKANFSNQAASSDERRLRDTGEARSFYRKLTGYYQYAMYFLHVRGTLHESNESIPFELIPRPNENGTPSDRILVFADDIMKAAKENSRTADEIRENVERRIFVLWSLSQSRSGSHVLGQLATTAARTGTPEPAHPRDYYLYVSNWRGQMEQFYTSRNYPLEKLAEDAAIAELYFKAIHYPHFRHNASLLSAASARMYATSNERRAAIDRLNNFFRHIGVKTPFLQLTLPLRTEDSTQENQVIDYCLQSYLGLFPGAQHLKARLAVDEAFLGQIVDDQLGQFPDLRDRRDEIIGSIRTKIENLNRTRLHTIEQIAETSLQQMYPVNDAQREEFEQFATEWQRENEFLYAIVDAGEHTFDVENLRRAYSHFVSLGRPYDMINGVLVGAGLLPTDDYIRFLLSWNQRKVEETQALKRLLNDRDLGVSAYLKKNYNGTTSEVSFTATANIISEVMKNYLTGDSFTGRSGDIDDSIDSAIGDQFREHPMIRRDLVAFYHVLIHGYLQNTYLELMIKFEKVVETINTVTDPQKVPSLYRLSDLPKFVREDILEPNGFVTTKELASLDNQVFLLARALGERPPTVHLNAYIEKRYERLNAAIGQAYLDYTAQRTEDRSRLDENEFVIGTFLGKLGELTSQYSGVIYTYGMDNDSVAAATARLEQGLAAAARLEEEYIGSILDARREVGTLTKKLGRDDRSIVALNRVRVEEGIETVRGNLNGQLARIAADRSAAQYMPKINELQGTIGGLLQEAEGLRESIGNFNTNETDTSHAADNFDDYTRAWATLSEQCLQVDKLQGKINDLERRFEEALASFAQEGQLRETASEEIGLQLLEAEEKLERTKESIRTKIAESELSLGRVRGALAEIESGLAENEGHLPIPSALTLPVDTTPYDLDMIYTPDNRLIAFNTFEQSNIDQSRIYRVRQALTDVRLLVSGGRAYLIDPQTASRVRSWSRTNREEEIAIRDIFNSPVTIPIGFRGVNVFDHRTDTPNPLERFLDKLNFALSLQPESSLIVRLYELARSSNAAETLVQQLVSGIAQDNVRTNADVRRFIRRFALSRREEIGSQLGDYMKTWFIEGPRPLRHELASSQLENTEMRPVDTLIRQLETIEGYSAGRTEEMLQGFFDALRPLLSTPGTEWLNRQGIAIHPAFAVAWDLINQAHNKTLLQAIFLHNISDIVDRQLDAGRTETLPAELIRYSINFSLEYFTELRYGGILYNNGRRIYGFECHRELFQFYEAVASGRPAIGPEPTVFETRHARSLRLIFGEPHRLGLGHMIDSIIHPQHSSHFLAEASDAQEQLAFLFDRHNDPARNLTDEELDRNLLPLEGDVAQMLQVFSDRAVLHEFYDNAVRGFSGVLPAIWDKLPYDVRDKFLSQVLSVPQITIDQSHLMRGFDLSVSEKLIRSLHQDAGINPPRHIRPVRVRIPGASRHRLVSITRNPPDRTTLRVRRLTLTFTRRPGAARMAMR